MKNFLKTALALILPLTVTACISEDHFLTDKAYRKRVHDDFMARRELAAGRSEALFSVFETDGLSAHRREALEFLYAYMPLCDLSEHDGEYFLRQVDGAFRARETFPWGMTVPEEIFRHFVLVHRVNNEYTDDARDIFFEELADRVRHLSMYDAALEVNHWCHEKVTYRATDARTSAPLALMKTSWGRCGEESVFTVAALRSVGIPARQCYTPRWVHTDSNHAWVEVWVDGRWHYMGACEPEAELDAAWFDGPVKRAMMTHTTVYGLYDGPEEKSIQAPLYSVINTLSSYTDTRRAVIRVVGPDGDPVADARVQFKVYNYGRLYPIVTLRSDPTGRAAITTGKGDLVVWADKDGLYGYVKSGSEDTEVTVVIDRSPGAEYCESFVMEVPPELPFRELPEEKIAANALRLAYEDSVRNAYMSTFPDEEYCRSLALETGLDQVLVRHYIHTAQGNWSEIENFLRERGEMGLQMLSTLREKDIRDTPASSIGCRLPRNRSNGRNFIDDDFWRYIASPRIGYELIKPLPRIDELLPERDGGCFDGDRIISHIKNNVRISDADNYYNCRQTPTGVHTLRVADRESRDIYFVALCRAAGIKSRLDPSTGAPQYRTAEDRQWVNAVFDTPDELSSRVPPKGRLLFESDTRNLIDPGYGTHFTVAVYRDGDFQTLNLGSDFSTGFPSCIELEEGYYRLLTAGRANDGSATIDVSFFNIEDNRETTVNVRFPEIAGKLFVRGVVDMNTVVETENGERTTLKKLARGKGVVLCFADPDKEPTKHVLQELPAHRQRLEEWGGGLVFCVPDDKRTADFDPVRFGPNRAGWCGPGTIAGSYWI